MKSNNKNHHSIGLDYAASSADDSDDPLSCDESFSPVEDLDINDDDLADACAQIGDLLG